MGKSQVIELSVEQRQELHQVIHSGNAPARTQTRARILLLSASEPGAWRSAPAVARALDVHPNTVRNVRRRFVAEGLAAALSERPRPGAAPKLTGEIEAQLTVLACSQPPAGHAEWTLRLLADELVALGTLESVSHTTVGHWLKKQTQALAGNHLVYPQGLGALRGQDGGYPGCLPAPVGPGAAPGLSG